jgi:hypothetical protein
MLLLLLDALEAEILCASVEEVGAALCDAGRARDDTCRELRTLLSHAEKERTEQSTPMVSDDKKSELDIRRH